MPSKVGRILRTSNATHTSMVEFNMKLTNTKYSKLCMHTYFNGSIERLNWCEHSKRFMQSKRKKFDIFECLRMEYTKHTECGFHYRKQECIKMLLR